MFKHPLVQIGGIGGPSEYLLYILAAIELPPLISSFVVGTPAASPTAACSPALNCGTSNQSRASPEEIRVR